MSSEDKLENKPENKKENAYLSENQNKSWCYFHLFDLPLRTSSVNIEYLEDKYLSLLSQHRKDIEMCSEINLGYKTLKNPVKRTEHLLETLLIKELRNISIDSTFLEEYYDDCEYLELQAKNIDEESGEKSEEKDVNTQKRVDKSKEKTDKIMRKYLGLRNFSLVSLDKVVEQVIEQNNSTEAQTETNGARNSLIKSTIKNEDLINISTNLAKLRFACNMLLHLSPKLKS